MKKYQMGFDAATIVGGFIVQQTMAILLRNIRLRNDWKESGYGYKKKLSNWEFRQLLKMAINGELVEEVRNLRMKNKVYKA